MERLRLFTYRIIRSKSNNTAKYIFAKFSPYNLAYKNLRDHFPSILLKPTYLLENHYKNVNFDSPHPEIRFCQNGAV